MNRILILGAGGFGRSLAEIAAAQGRYQAVGYLDDALAPGQDIRGLPAYGPMESLSSWRGEVTGIALGVGNNGLRAHWASKALECGFDLITLVHPWTNVSPSATLGPGTIVMPGAVIGSAARLGKGVIVNAGAVMDHDTVVEDFGHLGVNAAMAGGAWLGERSWLQCGACLGTGVRMPSDAVLSAGEGRARWNE